MVNRLFQSTMQPFQSTAQLMAPAHIEYSKEKQVEKQVELTENSQLTFSPKPIAQRIIFDESSLTTPTIAENCGKYSTMRLATSTLNDNWSSEINSNTSTPIYNARHLESSKFLRA